MDDDDGARRLQIATTAHFVLGGQRGATIAESTGRASLFASTVSLVMVALGFTAGATDMDRILLALACLVFSALLLLGGLTFLRLVQTGIEDMDLVWRIHRIEAVYEEIAPGSLVWREAGEARAGVQTVPGALGGGLQLFVTSSALIAALNGLLSGAAAGLGASMALGWGFGASAAVAAAAFATLFGAQQALSRALWLHALGPKGGARFDDDLSSSLAGPAVAHVEGNISSRP